METGRRTVAASIFNINQCHVDRTDSQMTPHSKLPLSPHLQIYRLPLSAILSITHRATGVILALGVIEGRENQQD